MKTIRCAVYTRVSVDDEAVQTQEFNTLDNQLESCRAYIQSQKSNGWEFLREYRDRGKSAKDLHRPALRKMMEDIRAGEIDRVVVYKIDRLSRKHQDFYDLLELFEKAEVQFVSTTQQFDTGTPAGRLLLHIMMEFAQYEREMVQERTHEKRWAMARKGMWTGGTVPIGYRLADKKLVVNPEEAAVVKKLYGLYVEHGNLTTVAQQLNRQGHTTGQRVANTGRIFKGTRWDKKKVSRVLLNPVYIGYIRYTHPKTRKEYIYPGQQAPIIRNKRLWEETQKILEKNREIRKSYKQNKYRMLFLGLIRCDACGTIMTNSSRRKPSGKLYLYYKCTSVDCGGKEACSVRSVSASALEEALVAALEELGEDATLLENSLKQAGMDKREGVGKLRQERKDLNILRTKTQGEIRALLETLVKLPKGVELNSIATRIAELETALRSTEEEICRVQANIDTLERHTVDEETYKKLFRQFGRVFERLNFEEKRNLILLLVKEVIYTPERIRIRFWGDLKDIDLVADKKTPTRPPETNQESRGSDVRLPG